MRRSGMKGNRRDWGANFFLGEALAVFSAIAETPQLHPVVHRNTRRALLRRFPFGVYYQMETAAIVVVAVMHGSRNPDHWKRRE